MGCKILVFAGTTEGREVVFRLLEKNIQVKVSVASEYGKLDLENLGEFGLLKNINDVLVGKLDQFEIYNLLKTGEFRAVVDATHPYATKVSENIFYACQKSSVPCFRVERKSPFSCDLLTSWSREFNNLRELCNFLAYNQEPCYSIGNIFVSTGSKEIDLFSIIPNYKERIFARVLPSVESIEKCRAAGLLSHHIIAMQGPFSAQLNAALFREYDIKILVTKESGNAGGFFEKLEAAKACNVISLLVKKPLEQNTESHSVDEVVELISNL